MGPEYPPLITPVPYFHLTRLGEVVTEISEAN